MILTTKEELKKYVSVSQSFEFQDFEPYINKAINAFTRKYVGNLHEELKDETEESADNAKVKNEARSHLQNAISNFGYFIYLPFASVQMDSSGISVASNENRKSAEWWQINDIRRELLRSGHEAMDYLLLLLEKNPEVFTTWTEEFGTINKELLVNNTNSFNKYYNIFNSRQTFLALQPTIRKVEDQYLHTLLCPELIEALKGNVTGNLKTVKDSITKAIVAFTVAKVANVGLFLLDENGLRVNFQNLIDGKKESATTGKPADQIEKLVNEQIDSGTNYLGIVKSTIEENLSEFNQCEFPLIKTKSTGSAYEPYDTTGVLSI
jgi:hypothetical protein